MRKLKPRGKPFEKGRAKTGGRAPGTPNKVTVEVKEFFRQLVEDPLVQRSFRAQIIMGEKGAMAAFLGSAAHVIGRPKETVAVETTPNMSKLLIMAITRMQEKEKGKADGT